MLLERGADVNTQGGGFDGNTLQAASARGHEKVVQMLLEPGADVNVQGGHVAPRPVCWGKIDRNQRNPPWCLTSSNVDFQNRRLLLSLLTSSGAAWEFAFPAG